MTTQYRHIHPLHCSITGVHLGNLDLTITAGHMPYLSHWNEMVCRHALFSLTPYKLIEFMQKEWARLGKDIADETVSERESVLLQVGFVALLYQLDTIRQDRNAIGIPSISTVSANLESLITLSGWKNYLASKRFAFPELHISTLNGNGSHEQIGSYLEACWDVKKAWEAGLNDELEKEKSRAAEKAIISIRNNFFKPVSKKVLWSYVKGQLDRKWKDDQWLATIFLGANSNVINWDWDEIQLFEEIIQSCLPPNGSVVNHAVRERIDEIKKAHKDHYDVFTIEASELEFIETLKDELQQQPAPKMEDFPTKGQFYVAKARWDLAHPSNYEKKTTQQIIDARSKLDNQQEKL